MMGKAFPGRCRRAYRVLLRVMLVFFLGSSGLLRGQASSEPPATMQAVLQEGVTSFTQGNYEQAARAFARLETQFGREPQYAPLPRTLLPVWAYAEAQAGNTQRAIELFERFLKEYPDERERRSFALYSIAQAYQTMGEQAKAIEAYQRFIELAPDSPEAVLSAMRQAELYFEMGDDEAGIERLVGFSESPRVPATLQAQARLRAIQRAQATGLDQQAAELLLTREWNIQTMPELAVLSFAALKAGDTLLADENIEDAIRLYRLVPPMGQLITVQRQKLAALEAAYEERQRQSAMQAGAIWNDYYRGLIGQVRRGLEALQGTEDYTPGMQIRLGQAFLVACRYREAAILYRHLAEDDELDPALRAQAHYCWILTANAVEDWDESLAISRSFLERYPDNTLAPEALYLIANAFEGQRRYRDAVGVLDELLERYPDHGLRPRWLFARGYNQTLADNFDAAREDFQRYLSLYPAGPQAPDARLWYALSWFFERRYDEALAAFDEALGQLPPHHRLLPETEYRRANTLYAMRDYDVALPAIERFIQSYTGHARIPEARVLRGDILMGQGRLVEASVAFAQVTPEADALYPYAVFQRGKIMRALEAYDLMIDHFNAYVASEDVPQKVRVAEALYWIGWAYSRKDEREQAFPVFVSALENYGNDRYAGETDGILQALHRLHQEYLRGETPDLQASPGKASALLAAESFEDFLLAERANALREGRLTYYSRLNLYLASLEERRKNTDRAEAYLWEIVEHVPPEQMDAQGLAETGLILQAGGFLSARPYLERLLKDFPARQPTGAAYYGLARIAFDEGDLPEARRQLDLFRAEAPMHPLAPDATLLQAQVLTGLGQTDRAIELLEDLLRIREHRGRPHARALLGIAQAHEAAHEPQKAIAFYQRIYTAYRAYPELLEPAYTRSAALFEEIGDPRAALNTYREMLADERLRTYESYAKAQAEAERLATTLPEEPQPAEPTDPATGT